MNWDVDMSETLHRLCSYCPREPKLRSLSIRTFEALVPHFKPPTSEISDNGLRAPTSLVGVCLVLWVHPGFVRLFGFGCAGTSKFRAGVCVEVWA